VHANKCKPEYGEMHIIVTVTQLHWTKSAEQITQHILSQVKNWYKMS